MDFLHLATPRSPVHIHITVLVHFVVVDELLLFLTFSVLVANPNSNRSRPRASIIQCVTVKKIRLVKEKSERISTSHKIWLLDKQCAWNFVYGSKDWKKYMT